MKHPFDMTKAEYQKLARAADRRHGAPRVSKTRRPRANPPMVTRSFKITVTEWAALKREAKARRVSVSALLRAFALARNAHRVVLTP